MTTTTADRLRVAMHEAGHLVAAVLSGVEGVRSHLDPPSHPHLEGATWFNADGNYALTHVRAFIHFAGPWAESKFLGADLAEVIASTSASGDREHFEMYRLFHANVDRDWADLLSPCWPTIERAAVLMAAKDTPLLPTDALPTPALVEQVLAGFR